MSKRASGFITTLIFGTAMLVVGVMIGQSGLLVYFGGGAGRATPAAAREAFEPFWEVWNYANQQYFDQPLDPDVLVEGAIEGMLATLGDQNTVYLSPEEQQFAEEQSQGEYQGIGAEVVSEDGAVIIVSPIDGSPAERAGLLPGDIIRTANGVDLTGMDIGDAAATVRGPVGTPVLLVIERDGTTFEVELIRAVVQLDSVRAEMLEEGIAYVRLSRFGERTAQELEDALEPLLAQNPAGLIIDLRNNPGGALTTVVDVADQFLADGLILTERYGNGTEDVYRAKADGLAQEIPLVVLINEGSASASEVLAGAIRDQSRGVLIGAQSFGKGTVQVWLPLSNQGGVRLTVARWLTPDGTWVHETGLTPEYVIPSRENRDDPDLQLDGALDYLLGREIRNLVDPNSADTGN